ncbi:beta-CASP ribonuclease aCPSF1 [Desulfurococcus mucosus]|uniref:Transcription termination factor FttA n=1 Tax=Desulfurococcus mucosus (strain ATCC 35584 / DSM 2162 / JCM 9187 / O7/1) TaxID=765177 RepID=E8R7A4_DESM0|nr:beta-CASP ribonuclease aCPSF1 [Desulfurococcus mucosus]ADV65569.1 KH-domain/beta-lactamase-domain protein [Desulfurococcus mucosus DSM 2162]
MKLDRILLEKNKLELLKNIMEEIPAELELSNIEFEGPFIVIYVRNREAIEKYLDLAQNIAKKVRKRVVIRVAPESRLPPGEAKEKIKELAPKDAGVDPNGIYFDEASGEVWVKVEKPGYLVGKGSTMRHLILAKTGWRVIPQRSSPLESKALYEVLNNVLKQSSYRVEFLRRLGERIHRDVVFKNNYVKVTGLGGFREVGRSSILVETRESKVLLDLGINTGAIDDPGKAYPLLEVDSLRLDELDGVIVTHAHLDHVGLVPVLYKYGYRGPVYVTKPTRELMIVMLKDLVDVTRRSGRYIPFSEKDISTMLLHTITVDYDEVTDVAPDIKLTMYNAGHILGSAIVHLHVGMGLHNIVYTGDFKYSDSRLLNKANTVFPRVETLIMEGTYGATLQENRAQAEQGLVDIVKRTAERKGIVLIPVFAVGRGQEIILILNEAMKTGRIPRMNIYVEGLVNEVTAIHTQYPEYLNRSLREAIYNGDNPFTSEWLKPIESGVARPDIVEDRPSVIIATSGMLTGGPAVDYLRLLAGDERNSLVFVGYQAEGTLGRKIKDGAREVTMVSENRVEAIHIKLEVYSIEGFSGHSDQRELLEYARDISPRPRRILLNHGEPSALSALSTLLKGDRELRARGRPEVLVPNILDTINLT